MQSQQQLDVPEGDSQVSKIGGIVLTVRATHTKRASVVIGRPGLPNSVAELDLGDAKIFETPDGLFEIRLLRVSGSGSLARFLLTEIAPRPGLAAGYVDQDAGNLPFSVADRARLAQSIAAIRLAMSDRIDVSDAQVNFILTKLDEMEVAAERLGRKDWINWALGTLTSVVVTAALDPAAAQALFRAADSALGWVLGASIQLIGH